MYNFSFNDHLNIVEFHLEYLILFVYRHIDVTYNDCYYYFSFYSGKLFKKK